MRGFIRFAQASLDPRTEPWRGLFQSWLMARFKALSLDEILKMLGELTPLEETRAYLELVAKGRQEGREREVRLVLRQRQRRLDPVSPAQQARIAAPPIDALEDLGEAPLDFADTADLDAWLATH